MPDIDYPTIPINFSDKVQKETLLFNYNNNVLYNLSVPLLSIILTLSRLPKPENLSLFKSLLKQHIVDLSEQGKNLDYPSAVIDKLCCLHCIVLDEFIIHGAWGADAGWENNTLLSELFGLKNGGDLFFTITDKALKQSIKMKNILELSYVFLQMGFKGRYRSRQSEQLGVITKQIHQSIDNQELDIGILIKDAPITKSLFLKNGARYFSFTVVILFTLTLVFTFLDYWFKETYYLRSKEFNELQKVTENHILNTQAKEIIYISTDEDIHAVKNLTQYEESLAISNIKTAHKYNALDLTDIKQSQSDKFRVQLASFSSQANANKYLIKLVGSNYSLSIMPIGSYFIVYSTAQTLSNAKAQQKYFKDNYQISTIRVEVSDNGNQK